MKYDAFDDYFWEIENYCTRGERFHEEFQHVDIKTRTRIIEWMQASWDCARTMEISADDIRRANKEQSERKR